MRRRTGFAPGRSMVRVAEAVPKLTVFLVALCLPACAGADGGVPADGEAEAYATGTWRADYPDSAGVVHPRFITSRKAPDGPPAVTMDEPGEDWYDIPVTVTGRGDELCLALWWGAERLCGALDSTTQVFSGTRDVSGATEPFTYPRIAGDTVLDFQHAAAGRSDGRYRYRPPEAPDGELPTGGLEATGADIGLIEALMDRILEGSIGRVHSVLVVQDGELLVEEYFYGYSADRPHRVHSVTKSVTGALVGIAIEEGRIGGTDELVAPYFPGHDDSRWVREGYPIEIVHLLSMTSGLDWRPLTTDDPDIMAMYASPDPVGYAFDQPLEAEPGSLYFYNDANSVLLGLIVEKATATPLEVYAQRTLFDPLGISQPSWDRLENGLIRAEGGLRLRPRDMAKLGLLYLHEGRWDGQAVVPEAWVEASLQRNTRPGQQPYGYQWWIHDLPVTGRAGTVRAYTATGFGGQFIMVLPELDMVTVFTAGNYFQPEDLALRLMSEYVLPAFIG